MNIHKARTINLRKTKKEDREFLESKSGTYVKGMKRQPRTRGGCKEVYRPCPFVGCKYHLYLDVSNDGTSIKFNFPEIMPEQMDPRASCALDVALRGDHTLEEVGEMMNITRERVRQIEEMALLEVLDDEELGRFYYD